MLCKAVLTVVHNYYLFLYMKCLGGLHYNSLYALSLHNTFAHLWVPFSLGVSQNKRCSHIERTKTLNLLKKLQFILLKLICTLNTAYLNLVLGVSLKISTIYLPSSRFQVSVEPSAISAYIGTGNWEQAEGLRLPTYIDRQR